MTTYAFLTDLPPDPRWDVAHTDVVTSPRMTPFVIVWRGRCWYGCRLVERGGSILIIEEPT